jgi:NAD(P)-dependent dehydrogenase (short-subunit alcohol dehydrogenase family)
LTLEKRVALVTGAARGISRWVALALAERGYAVATNDLDAPEGTLEKLEQAGVEALSVPGDISDEEAVRWMVESRRRLHRRRCRGPRTDGPFRPPGGHSAGRRLPRRPIP